MKNIISEWYQSKDPHGCLFQTETPDVFYEEETTDGVFLKRERYLHLREGEGTQLYPRVHVEEALSGLYCSEDFNEKMALFVSTLFEGDEFSAYRETDITYRMVVHEFLPVEESQIQKACVKRETPKNPMNVAEATPTDENPKNPLNSTEESRDSWFVEPFDTEEPPIDEPVGGDIWLCDPLVLWFAKCFC